MDIIRLSKKNDHSTKILSLQDIIYNAPSINKEIKIYKHIDISIAEKLKKEIY